MFGNFGELFPSLTRRPNKFYSIHFISLIPFFSIPILPSCRILFLIRILSFYYIKEKRIILPTLSPTSFSILSVNPITPIYWLVFYVRFPHIHLNLETLCPKFHPTSPLIRLFHLYPFQLRILTAQTPSYAHVCISQDSTSRYYNIIIFFIPVSFF